MRAGVLTARAWPLVQQGVVYQNRGFVSVWPLVEMGALNREVVDTFMGMRRGWTVGNKLGSH